MNIDTLRAGQSHPHPEPISGASYSAAELMPGDQRVVLLDQRKLPAVERYEFFTHATDVADAIRTMVVRGAPAIGVAAAYAMVLAARDAGNDFMGHMRTQGAMLDATRPTAVNLAHAIRAMLHVAESVAELNATERISRLADAAREYHAADVAACKRMGELGARLLPNGCVVLTHCNAGALATGGFGTALGVIRAARKAGNDVRVVACETRPLLQGARLTLWELQKDHIPTTLITDSMVAQLMRKGGVQACVVGADRIARNGDVANKVGTYSIACLARAHGIPMYVAAPWSTIDLACESGTFIPIEERDAREVTHPTIGDVTLSIAPDATHAMNPSFDVTPAELVRAIFTERGVVSPVTAEGLRALA
jgi:methylthioribose-1-phosphate isomerase